MGIENMRPRNGAKYSREVTLPDGRMLRYEATDAEHEAIAGIVGSLKNIRIAETRTMTAVDKSPARFTRYHITQHRYMGAQGGYIEVLEIHDAPDGRCPYVVHVFNVGDGSVVYEFDSVASAVAGLSVCVTSLTLRDDMPSSSGIRKSVPGCLRHFICGPLTPWFYAVGHQPLIGDYAVAAGFEDDPYFRLGRRYKVFGSLGKDSDFTSKVCLGSRLEWHNQPSDRQHDRMEQVRVVYWDDGSTWPERGKYFFAARRPELVEEPTCS